MNPLVTSKLNKETKSLIEHLFYDKMIQLETEAKNLPSFSKQVEIKKTQDKVSKFIDDNPYSNFELRVLYKNTEDRDNFKVAINFSNYNNLISEKKPSNLMIIVDSSFNNVEFYQWSLNNILLPVR